MVSLVSEKMIASSFGLTLFRCRVPAYTRGPGMYPSISIRISVLHVYLSF